MADDDIEYMSADQHRAIRDYWLQFHRQKKFTLPEELEQASGKSLEEMGLTKRDFKIKDSSRGVQISDFKVERSNVRSQFTGLTDGNGILDWTAADIATSGYDPYGLFVADMDNDGDMDIIVAFIEDDTIVWYENNAGIPEFSNIMMPIVSVLAIVGLNYRRRKINLDE
jgi:hypothetical protein